MRNRLCAIALAALATVLAAPRTARACGRGGYSGYGGLVVGVGIGGLALLGGDVAFSLMDLHHAVSGEPPSIGYGVGEFLVAAPQLALGIAGASSTTSKGLFTGYSIWMGALTVHALWTIVTAAGTPSAPLVPPPPDPPDDPYPNRVQLGLGPTYVPLGPLARPGVGLIARF